MENRYQTRDEIGELRYFPTLKEAMDYANEHDSVWKVSWALHEGSEFRCRLVFDEDSDIWQYEPIEACRLLKNLND
jgi:hypothetical protein